MAGKRKRRTTETFIAEAVEAHGEAYGYDKVVFSAMSTPVLIHCNLCDQEFRQIPKSHLKGHGCASCSAKKRAKERLRSIDTFVEKAREVHGEAYGYDKVDYQGSWKDIEILCRSCDKTFSQAPANHLQDHGCPACGYLTVQKKLTATAESFLEMAREVHGDKFQYPELDLLYDAGIRRSNIKIQCSKCERTSLVSSSHHIYSKSGCPVCAKLYRFVSAVEAEWLDSLGVSLRQYRATLVSGKRVCVDGYDPKTNTVYEFLGDFWHGNPDLFDQDKKHPVIKGKTYGQIFDRTMKRLDKLKAKGYNVVYIWEQDWRQVSKSSMPY